MSLESPAKKRGRPALDQADALRAKACWHWVRNRSGLTNEAVEMLLTPDNIRHDGSKIKRPRKWDRYERGDMCPSDDGTPTGTVGSVEEHYPGFRAFYSHPLWDAIGSKGLTEEDLIALMRRLPAIEALLFEPPPEGVTPGQPIPSGVWLRRRPFEADVFKGLCETRSMDSLAAFILMVREAALLGSPDYRSDALQGYRSQIPWLRGNPDFAAIATEFSDLIDQRFMQQVFVYPNRRLNIFIVTKNFTDKDLAE